MGRNYRKRRADEDADEVEVSEPVPSADDLKQRLEDTRRLQQERARARGLDVSRLGALSAEGQPAVAQEEAPAEQEEGLRLRNTFSAEQQQVAGQEDPNMLKYIEAELARRRGATNGGGAVDTAPTNSLVNPASLYEVPPELRAGPPGGASAADDGGGAWLTGIQEVALPVAVKLKNIEDTERAKAALLEAHRSRMAGEGEPEPNAPVMDAARFMAPRSMLPQEPPKLGSRVPVSTDDIVARRFIQSEKRRAQRR